MLRKKKKVVESPLEVEAVGVVAKPVAPKPMPKVDDVHIILGRIEAKIDGLIKKDEEVHKQIPT
jgi:hypothetical protein